MSNSQAAMLTQIRKGLISMAEAEYRDFTAKLLPKGEKSWISAVSAQKIKL